MIIIKITSPLNHEYRKVQYPPNLTTKQNKIKNNNNNNNSNNKTI